MVLLVGMVLTCSAFAAFSFTDVDENAAYAHAVEYVNDRGIMSGYSDGGFRPMNALTRAQMTAVLCRMLGQNNPSVSNGKLFSDVPSSYWANAYITYAASLNIINGFNDGTFRPDHALSCNQGIAMLLRAFGLRDESERADGYPTGYLSIAQKYRLLDGVSFDSTGILRRYEIAVIIYNYYKGNTTPQNEPSQIVNSSLPDGEYRMRIFKNQLGTDRFGYETAYVEVLEPIILDDSYVRSLKIGDMISLKAYGLSDEIVVSESFNKAEDEITVDDYTYLTPYGAGWMIWQNNIPCEYVADRRELVLSADTVIIDGHTPSMETGMLEERQLDNLQSFFKSGWYGEKVVNVTITGGKVVKVYIPYTPM